MSRRLCQALVPLTLMFLMSITPTAAAQEESASQEVESITMRLVVPRNEEIPPQFEVVATDADGQPVAGVTVEFTREVEFLGTTRYASLGTATTDIGGVARLVVLPRSETAVVVASVPSSEASATLDVTYPSDRVNPFFDPDPPPNRLQPLRELMPLLIAAAVGLLWVFVIALVVRTLSRIKRAGETGEQAT